ncbi:MAG: imidazolonepropionase [Bacteroidia bacterium]|jgi:imidazolonepropionase|nr:imidazolonepropionase [Bacteroidia bacterium]
MSLLVKNIRQIAGLLDDDVQLLKGAAMQQLQTIDNAFLWVEGERIADFGSMDQPEMARYAAAAQHIVDAGQGWLLPSFCDSHTHLVYPASREIEYVDKIRGLSYEEIAKRGGGILNSSRKMAETSKEQLIEDAMERLAEIAAYGTGAVEIKSGYGLNTENELKMLRVIRELKQRSSLQIVSTFLGAHAIPQEYKGRQEEYVDLIINEMIPMVAGEELADFIDVFCDKGFFTEEDTDRILNAGMKYGLRPKIHANELARSGGIQIGVKYNALSVDHLEFTYEEEIELLKSSDTIPTILPGSAFFLNMPLAPARKMIDAGLPVAFASDFNPGSSPSGNMQLILSMACIQFRLLPNEAINATTINGAAAMDLSHITGSITRGKLANFYITRPMPSLEYLPYYYGVNKVGMAFLKGKRIV